MAFANKVRIPYTVYGGLSTGYNGGVDTLSGFTNKLTTFRFVVSRAHPSFNYISSNRVLWDFVYGTQSTNTSATHIYHYPGYYNVTLVAYDSAGNEYLSTTVNQLSVSDFFPDRLNVVNDYFDTINIPVNIKNAVKVPITIERQNTHQLHRSLSGNKYTINLYASGSESYDKSFLPNTKWGHLDKTWSFYQTTTADNNTIITVPVSAIETTTEKIYYKTFTKFGKQHIERVPCAEVPNVPTSRNPMFRVPDGPPMADPVADVGAGTGTSTVTGTSLVTSTCCTSGTAVALLPQAKMTANRTNSGESRINWSVLGRICDTIAPLH